MKKNQIPPPPPNNETDPSNNDTNDDIPDPEPPQNDTNSSENTPPSIPENEQELDEQDDEQEQDNQEQDEQDDEQEQNEEDENSQDSNTPPSENQDAQCNGCPHEPACLPFGHRLEIQGESKYCSVEKTFKTQVDLGATCQNDYECLSNECSNKECISTFSLIKRLLDFLNNFFENIF